LVFLLLDAPLVADEWQAMFDGKTLDGWKAADHDECFNVKDEGVAGVIERSPPIYKSLAGFNNFSCPFNASSRSSRDCSSAG